MTKRRSVPLAIAIALAVVALPFAAMAAQDMTDAAGPQSAHILRLWHLTVLVCSVVFAATLVAFLIALWRAPRAGADAPADVSGLTRVERGPKRSVVLAVGVSSVLLVLLLLASVTTDRALAHLVLRDALHIELTAHQWWWSARYDDVEPSHMFTTANELHIPVGRPVILTLNSDDVIHSCGCPISLARRI